MPYTKQELNRLKQEFKTPCVSGKVMHFTEFAALATDDYLLGGLYVYKCPLCKFYHLTKQIQK